MADPLPTVVQRSGGQRDLETSSGRLWAEFKAGPVVQVIGKEFGAVDHAMGSAGAS